MISLTFDTGGLQVNLAQAPQVIGVQLQKWMTQVMAHLHAAVSRNMGDGALIGVRTGDLRRALTELVTVSVDGVTGELWPDPAKVPYGSIQEDGGTIVPKNAQMLAIPLEAMQTSNGVARGTALQVAQDPGAFGFSSTFVPKGHHVIFGIPEGAVRGGRAAGAQSLIGQSHLGTVIPLFALVASVTIPGRHYLATTLIQEWQWIADLLEQITQDSVNVIFGEGAFAS